MLGCFRCLGWGDLDVDGALVVMKTIVADKVRLFD